MNPYHDHADPSLTDLRVNLLKAPWGISRHGLRFSWVIDSRQKNVRQTAYRLTVAHRAENLAHESYLYDSGWVNASQSTAVAAEGLATRLSDNTLYHWQVAVRVNTGDEPLLSRPAVFSTAKGDAWLSTRGIWHGENDFLFLRREFSLSSQELGDLEAALLTVTAASPEPTRQFVYNAYTNGTCVGVGPARVGKTPEGDAVLYYHTYDISESLTSGINCLSAICYALAGHAFLCELTLHFKNGTIRTVTNSGKDRENWRALGGDDIFGKDNSIGTHYFTAHACNVDVNAYPEGFGLPDFDDSGWSVPNLSANMIDFGLLLPDGIDFVTRYPRFAQAVTSLSDHVCVIDLGTEIVGGIRFEIDTPHRCAVTVRFGEQLNPDGTVKYRMNTGNIYTETWQLRAGKQTVETVDMMTYRYVQLENCPVAVTTEMITGLELRAPFDETVSDFDSDNPLLNDLYALTKHTVKVTTQDLYVDSQSRERGAYEGDLLVNLMASYAHSCDYSIGRFTAAYLATHRTWPAEYILLVVISAWEEYMTTGDDTFLQRYYPVLREKTFTDALNSQVGLIDLGNIPSSSTNSILVDWPHSERDGYDMTVTYNTVLNAMSFRAYRALSRIAYVTGHTEDGKTFAGLAETIRTALVSRVYDEATGEFCDGLAADGTPSPHASQHATAYALACGIYTDAAMADKLAETIKAQGKIRMSVYGAYFLLMGLYESGHGDVANVLLLDPDTSEGARTWAYMRYVMKATITTEAWNPINKPNMTLSHPWGAAPAHAITGGIFGIKPTSAGYDTFDITIQPHGLTYASLKMPTVKGSVAVSLEKGDTLTVIAAIPANTTAVVRLPAISGDVLLVDGTPTDTTLKGGYFTIPVGSGTWTFKVQNQM
ncbi:MAG: family 78 glycoside hydrolase catalytic domain [Clostridia bacterium]|nr:family 78 glycoside hydrolase catalytic domain [Clostridia bacterium]